MNLSRCEVQHGFVYLRGGLTVCLYLVFDLFYRSEDTYVYLIHLQEPMGTAQHYIGSTFASTFDTRMKQHRRKQRRFKITDKTLFRLSNLLSPEMLSICESLKGREFRKKKTFSTALGFPDPNITRLIMKHARQTNGSTFLIEANIRGIPWHVAKVWRANRTFEMWLKRQKNARRYCPSCQGVPF